MCWLVTCPAGKDIPTAYVDRAQSINKDGYGLTWFDNQVNVFKTMDFEEFKTKLATLTAFPKVVHLRYTSMGKTNLENSHPFDCGNGTYLFHNGTISSMKAVACTTTCGDNSDTRNLAEVIKLCKWENISDILPLVHQITGKSGNKLVFMEADGTVTIVNKDLGNEEDGIWYSNTYHVESKKYDYTNEYANYYLSYQTPSDSAKLTKVFVYGTLKRGFSNHSLLSRSKFLGKAETTGSYAMIGKDSPFPYVLNNLAVSDGGMKLKGEVFEVTDTVLAQLDRLEGVPTHYKKVTIYVKTETGQLMSCLIYMKTTVTDYDMQQPFIDEFTTSTINTIDSLTKIRDILNNMSTFELVDYLGDIEEEVYGKSYTTTSRYRQSKDYLIEEIMDALDLIDRMPAYLVPSTRANAFYLDD